MSVASMGLTFLPTLRRVCVAALGVRSDLTLVTGYRRAAILPCADLTMPTRPPTFKPLGTRTESQRKRDYSAQRRASQPGRNPYKGAWPKIRAAHLIANPLCVFHMEQWRLRVAANEVDHVDGDPWNNAPWNLRSLCKPCHSRRTARDQGFARG